MTIGVYRMDDGAVYHVVASSVKEALEHLFAVDAHDGWEDCDGIEWREVDCDEQIRIFYGSPEIDAKKVPKDCTQDDSGHWSATASAWAEACGPGVLCCSEWP